MTIGQEITTPKVGRWVLRFDPTVLPRLPGPNDRLSWRQRAAMTKAWRTAAYVASQEAGIPRLTKVRISAVFGRTNRHHRDEDNERARLKPLVDGLVGCWTGKGKGRVFLPGCLPDDNREHVEWGTVTEAFGAEPYIELTLEAIGPDLW